MTPSRLMLTIVTGGALLGVLGGQMARPVMKFADDAARHGQAESQFSASPAQYADAGPEDLSPAGWFGPAYARPADYMSPADYKPPADYKLPADLAPPAPEEYSVADEPEPYHPEVEQASADATETAAVLTEPQPAGASHTAGTSTAPAQAPPAGQTAADNTL